MNFSFTHDPDCIDRELAITLYYREAQSYDVDGVFTESVLFPFPTDGDVRCTECDADIRLLDDAEVAAFVEIMRR